MKINKFFVVIIFTLNVTYGNCARILGLFVVPSKSHHILGSKLLISLAEKGHEVTMVSPYPSKNKINNYRDIHLEEMLQFKEEKLQKLMQHNTSFWGKVTHGLNTFYYMDDLFLSSKIVKDLKKEKFDLIIQFALYTESFLGLAHHFDAPVILFNTLGAVVPLDKIIGNTSPPSYVPGFSLTTMQLEAEMTFLQRVFNTLNAWSFYALFAYLQDQNQQELLSKHFPEAPILQELIDKYVALVFVNSHYSIESPRPYVPNLIQIGGFHIEEARELPADLKQFLDKASGGAIFFSLGSNVKISSLPVEKVRAIVNVLGKLNMKVLFKTEENLPDLPTNIKTGKWLPQNDILAHPNVKLFISHGGLLSTTETVYHGVPLVGIPIFGDQQRNVADAVSKGYAVKVDLTELTEESFSNAINETLNNPTYQENAALRSSLLKDQPVKPLNKAIFWVEHVLKHKGAAHLKNASTKLYLYEYLLLDVIAFIIVTFLAIIFVIYKTIKKALRSFLNLFRKKKSKKD